MRRVPLLRVLHVALARLRVQLRVEAEPQRRQEDHLQAGRFQQQNTVG